MNSHYETLDNGAILIGDDVEVIRVLTEHGMLDKLVPIRGTDHNQASHCFEHGEYWCMATRHWNCQPESDNGYVLAMLPKSVFTKRQAVAFFVEILHETSVSKEFDLRLFDKTEIKNNLPHHQPTKETNTT